MMIRIVPIIASFLTVLVFPLSAVAAPIYDYFGPLSEATFGGTGIPNDAVAVATQIVDGDNIITIALSSAARFSNPEVTNDGAGTFFAGAGSNFGGAGESTIEGALWNFNYYINVDGQNTLTDYQFDLYYDFDPAVDTPLNSLGKIDVTNSVASGDVLVEGSQNLMFEFLSIDVPGYLATPSGAFDSDLTGEYTFAITATKSGGFPVEAVAMDVQVVPLPISLLMFGTGLIGLVGIARRRG